MRARALLAATFVVASVACSGGDPVAPVVPYTPPQTVTIKSVSVVGDTTLTTGESVQYCALVRYSNNTENPCLPVGVTWVSSDPSLVEVTSEGMVRAIRPGNVLISVTLQGVSGSASVAVARGWTPWDLLSSEEKAYFRVSTSGTFGRLWRWPTSAFPLRTWAAPGVNPADVAFMGEYLREKSNGKVTFVSVADSNSSQVAVRLKPEGFANGICGQAGIAAGADGVIQGVVIHLSSQPNCMRDSNWDRLRMTHEMLHGLGLLEEGPPNTDILSSSGTCWDISQRTSRLLNWLYLAEVWPGLPFVDY